MKTLLTVVIALAIGTTAFGQATDYKHPFAAKKAKEKNLDATEKFSTENLSEATDYKHTKTIQAVKRVRVRSGSGANSAAETKHPLG